jgi:hypothetical protein
LKQQSWTNGHEFAARTCLSVGGFHKVPQTGEKNELFGVFESKCCHAEIVITSGAKFPSCPNHPDDITTWNSIEVGPDNVVVLSTKKKSNAEPAA